MKILWYVQSKSPRYLKTRIVSNLDIGIGKARWVLFALIHGIGIYLADVCHCLGCKQPELGLFVWSTLAYE